MRITTVEPANKTVLLVGVLFIHSKPDLPNLNTTHRQHKIGRGGKLYRERKQEGSLCRGLKASVKNDKNAGNEDFFFFAGAPPSSSKQPPQKGTILDFFNETHARAAHTHTFLSARGISSMKSRNPIKTTPPTVFKVPLGLVVGVQ